MNHKTLQALFTFFLCVEGLEVGGFLSKPCVIVVFVITLRAQFEVTLERKLKFLK